MSKIIDTNTLKPFLENPNREYHPRELSRLLKISPTTAGKFLESLKKQNYLLKRKERGHLLYRANTDNEAYRDLKTHYNITKIKKSGLVDHLISEYNYPKTIILFGSYAKAENTPESDIDLFIASEITKEPNLKKFEKKLGCEIQLFCANKKKFNQMKENSKELLNNILNGKILYGYIEAFQ